MKSIFPTGSSGISHRKSVLTISSFLHQRPEVTKERRELRKSSTILDCNPQNITESTLQNVMF